MLSQRETFNRQLDTLPHYRVEVRRWSQSMSESTLLVLWQGASTGHTRGTEGNQGIHFVAEWNDYLNYLLHFLKTILKNCKIHDQLMSHSFSINQSSLSYFQAKIEIILRFHAMSGWNVVMSSLPFISSRVLSLSHQIRRLFRRGRFYCRVAYGNCLFIFHTSSGDQIDNRKKICSKWTGWVL